jgi:hypothetical protein
MVASLPEEERGFLFAVECRWLVAGFPSGDNADVAGPGWRGGTNSYKNPLADLWIGMLVEGFAAE